jgi:mRNA interferase HicA
MCTIKFVKRRDLLKRLADLGWSLERHGKEHAIWSNPSRTASEAMPRHREINERLADHILRNAKRNP